MTSGFEKVQANKGQDESTHRSKEDQVDVVIPAHNAGGFLKDAVDSVLNQNFDGVKCYVFDNNSTDGSVQFLDDVRYERVAVVRSSQTAPANESWTRATNMGHSRYVKLLCADDVLHSGAITDQLEMFREAEKLYDGPLPIVAAVNPRDLIVENTPLFFAKIVSLFVRTGWNIQFRKILRSKDCFKTASTADCHQVNLVNFSSSQFVRRVREAGGNFVGEPLCVLLDRAVMSECLPWDPDAGYVIDLSMWSDIFTRGISVWSNKSIGKFRVQSDSWSAEVASLQDKSVESWIVKHSSDPTGVAHFVSKGPNLRVRVRGALRRFVYGLVRLFHVPSRRVARN